MNKVIALVVIALAGFGSDANAQIRRQQATSAPPANWISVGVGAFTANSVSDGGSQTTWDFGSATTPQYRASLEKAFSNGIAVGLAGTYVKAPIRHSTFAGVRQDAEVNVYSLGLNFEAGSGQGFHQVYGGSIGMTRYDNFKATSDGAGLTPTEAVNAISGVFSYGFGYAFNARTTVVGVYDLGLVYHSRDGLASDQRNSLRTGTLRIGLRQGFGTRPAVRRRR